MNSIRTRLISFLGLGPHAEPPHYTPVVYRWDGRLSTPTPLVERAILDILGDENVHELVILGTEKVKHRWVDTGLLEEHLGRRIEVEQRPSSGTDAFVVVPDGQSTEELRGIFAAVLHALGGSDAADPGARRVDRVLLDITHGFRIQPILATSALAFAMSEWERLGTEDVPQAQVLYGAFEAGKGDEPRPIWDLTEIVTVARWRGAIDALLRYGRADALAALAAAASREAVQAERERGVEGKALGVATGLRKLGTAAQQFADDLALGRMSYLFTESAPQLGARLRDDATRHWVDAMPLLRPTVEELSKSVEPLCSRSVFGLEGLQSMVALARQYERTQRFAELAATLREGLVTLLTHLDGRATPGEPGPAFSTARREEAEHELGRLAKAVRGGDPLADMSEPRAELAKLAAEVMPTRNDVEHLGLNESPARAQGLRTKLTAQLDRFEALVRSIASDAEPAE